jgi:hypothetical protein
VVTKTIDIVDVIIPDMLGTEIARKYVTWDTARQPKIREWDEVRRFLFATDTSSTSNASLPWKNTTTTPKLCQIRDNLIANYMSSLFPRRGWLIWEGSREQDQEKKEAIELYMTSVVSEPVVKKQLKKCLHDYVDYGNVFASPSWIDQRISFDGDEEEKVGFVGPTPKRISPLDIVFDPTADSFEESPKIVRSLVSIGELRNLLESISPNQDEEEIQKMYDYLLEVRTAVGHEGSKITEKDDYYKVDGFDSFQHYMSSQYIEVLTFYGTLYDAETKEIYQNHQITVVDRHKVIGNRPCPTIFGVPPIYHTGWRIKQDNLWAMGPFENLVGLQYRIDHLENLKADVLDFTAAPPVKVKGYVEDFNWGPLERIYVGDDGDVEIIGPDTNILNVNLEINQLEEKMEQMAGAPKEALGIRSPGEKTAFEVQRLETAAARVFQAKILQFEEEFLEPLINSMLEMARRNLSSSIVRVLNDELKTVSFAQITNEDISAVGRIRPIAAKHFAEKAVQIQNLSQWYQQGIGSDPEVRQHVSSKRLAEISEELMDIGQFNAVVPYIRLQEQAEAQRMINSEQENIEVEAGTSSGLSEDDFLDEDLDEEDDLVQDEL